MVQASQSKKSGIRSFNPGEVLFNESDGAQSLFIIQSGQVRLYRPKGRGFVDLAILRAGEVIGEMAYFDEKSRRRSCSAAAIVATQVIEISFPAFEKTMSGLNPWFKTIINTLADRLRKTNERVKALESNSIGFGEDGKVGDYKFFHNTDILKMMSIIYLGLKSHGEEKDGLTEIHMNKLKFYMFDIFNVQEVKWEEFLNVLKDKNFIEIGNDESGLPKIVKVGDVNGFRQIVAFFNSQRILSDDKKMKISPKCERFLKGIIEQLTINRLDKSQGMADITAILLDLKERKIQVSEGDLRDATNFGLCEDILVGEGNELTSLVHFEKLKKVYPSIKMMNAIDAINEEKSGNKY